MTPLEIDIMLHYYSCANDWRNGDHTAPICKETFGWFLDQDLLKCSNFHVERFEDGTLKARYEVTERGRAYVEALKQVPLPTQIWAVPAQPERQFPLSSGNGK